MPKSEIDKKLFYCEKCGRTLRGDEFYTSNNLEKYPNGGKMSMCRKCMTMHVNNWDPDTYLWILQEADVPYIPKQWHKLMAAYAKDKSKVTGMTIIGRYLGAMKLTQWKKYRWDDTEHLQDVANAETEQAMRQQGYGEFEIAQAVKNQTVAIPEGELIRPPDPIEEDEDNEHLATGDEDYFESQLNVTMPDLNLTEEDIIHLRLKWGKSYKPEEWVKLEQLYNEMMESYDIQTAGHLDTLKLVCKTSLKANQLLDLGDVEGAQKMVKMYDGLMKSGRFTAAQNKVENGEYVDSVAELVTLCESQGFIPRYYTDGPQDKVDRVLQDFQGYVYNLVTEEMGLGNMIEAALKQIEADKEKEAIEASETADEDEILENSLFSEDAVNYISDNDFADFKEEEDEWAEQDLKTLEELLEDLESEGR